jgi:DNA-binding transcriptional regulator GbsR (MarR family)
MYLSGPMQRFVLHWGEMGATWGVNRSIAQVHALLYLAEDPMHAEEITETLNIARSNVSNSLKELQTLDLIKREQLLGDRRDHYTASHKPWDMLMAIADARKAREIDPTMEMLRECTVHAKNDPDTPAYAAQQMLEMDSFVSNVSEWYSQIRQIPQESLLKLMSLGSRITRFLGRRN